MALQFQYLESFFLGSEGNIKHSSFLERGRSYLATHFYFNAAVDHITVKWAYIRALPPAIAIHWCCAHGCPCGGSWVRCIRHKQWKSGKVNSGVHLDIYIYIYMSIIERYYIYIYFIGSACIVIYIYLAGPPARRPMMKLLVSAAAGRQPLK